MLDPTITEGDERHVVTLDPESLTDVLGLVMAIYRATGTVALDPAAVRDALRELRAAGR